MELTTVVNFLTQMLNCCHSLPEVLRELTAMSSHCLLNFRSVIQVSEQKTEICMNF
jgi:hypothetical protein